MNSSGYRSIVLACFAVLVLAVSVTHISDYDFWWHLKLGESVYTSGKIYTADTFSYTFSGQPQFNGEWMADLIIYLSYRFGGLRGVNLLRIVLLLLTFLFLFAAARNETEDDEQGFLAAVVTLVVILFALRFRLFVRPYLFSFLFFSVFISILGHYAKSRNLRVLFWLPLAEVLWANTSKGAFYGPLLSLIFFAGFIIERRDEARRLVPVFAGIAASALLNPATFQVYTLPLLYAGPLISSKEKMSAVLGEHQPMTFTMLWGYGLKYTFAYQILVAASLFYLIALRGWKRMSHLLLFCVFFAQSLLMVRMVDFFSLAAAVLALSPLRRLLGLFMTGHEGKRRLVHIFFGLLILLLVPLSVFGSRTYKPGIGVKENTFPYDAVSFLEREGISGTMFNSYALGGFLVWRSPERKVFIDGRGGPLYSSGFYDAYFKSLKDPEVWNGLDRRWRFDYAVLDYDLRDRRFPLHLNENPDWAPVYWDNHSVVYLKRTEKNRPVIEKYEYRTVKPHFFAFDYLLMHLHTKTGLAAAADMDREIALNPNNKEPLLAKAFLLYNLGRPYHGEALKFILAASRLKPEMAMEHSALAIYLLQQGQKEKAREEAGRALAIDPHDPGAEFIMKQVVK